MPSSALQRAPRELKAFGAVELGAGEYATLTLRVEPVDRAYRDIRVDQWVSENSTYLVDSRADAPRGIAPYFWLKSELQRIVGRDVDLVEARAVRNPFFAQRAFGEVVEVHAG